VLASKLRIKFLKRTDSSGTHIVDALLDGDSFRIAFQQDANVVLNGRKTGFNRLRLKIKVVG
jgi:hypothetical protein